MIPLLRDNGGEVVGKPRASGDDPNDDIQFRARMV